MAKLAPSPVDVQDFQFKLHCKLKIFKNENNDAFGKPCNVIAAASRYGLVFVGTLTNHMQVIETQHIETYSAKIGEIDDYSRRIITLPSRPKHLSVNCDQSKLSVIVEKDNCAVAVIYEVASFYRATVGLIQEIRLSATPGVDIFDVSWNPTIPTVLTVCKSDGSFGLFDFKTTGIEINELPPTSGTLCMCWSPKGKQIAVGSIDGKITQYKPDLKAAKVINSPPLEGSMSIISLQWVSNYQFIGVYKSNVPDSPANLLVIDAPKTGETTYINYDDVCFSFGSARPPQFYMIFQPLWNILMVASSNSMEVGVLNVEKEMWTQWILGDAARAELPLSASKQDTLPVGFGLVTGTTTSLILGENSIPPAPLLLILSNQGVLCSFHALNLKPGVPTLCNPPENVADKSGQSQFVKITPTTSVSVKPLAMNLNKPVVSGSQDVMQPIKFGQNISKSDVPQMQFSESQTSLGSSSSASSVTSSRTAVILNTPQTGNFSLFGQNITKIEPAHAFGQQTQSNMSSATSLNSDSKTMMFQTNTPISGTSQQTVTTNLQPVHPSVIKTANTDLPKQISNEENQSKPSSEYKSTVLINEKSLEETEALIAQKVREECINLEADLKSVLYKSRTLKVDVGSDAEATDMVQKTIALLEFFNDVTETSAAQAGEIHCLKQNLIQTWAWYEEARSRLSICKDPTLLSVLRSQPLDPASERQLVDIKHILYYVESQLSHANCALDEQWNNFQDSCKKILKLKLPTMEAIYQSMVRQNAVLQKETYVLKDISARMRATNRTCPISSLLVSLNSADALEEELKHLQLEPKDVFQIQYEKVLQRQKKLSSNKSDKLKNLICNRNINHVSVNKPSLANSSAQLSSFLALSPIVPAKKLQPQKLDFVQSTPKPTSQSIQKPVNVQTKLETKPERIQTPEFVKSPATKLLFGSQPQEGSRLLPQTTFKVVSSAPTSTKFTQSKVASPVTALATKTTSFPAFSFKLGPSASSTEMTNIILTNQPAIPTSSNLTFKFQQTDSKQGIHSNTTSVSTTTPSLLKFSLPTTPTNATTEATIPQFTSAFVPTSQNAVLNLATTKAATTTSLFTSLTTSTPSIFGKNSAFSITKTATTGGLIITPVTIQGNLKTTTVSTTITSPTTDTISITPVSVNSKSSFIFGATPRTNSVDVLTTSETDVSKLITSFTQNETVPKMASTTILTSSITTPVTTSVKSGSIFSMAQNVTAISNASLITKEETKTSFSFGSAFGSTSATILPTPLQTSTSQSEFSTQAPSLFTNTQTVSQTSFPGTQPSMTQTSFFEGTLPKMQGSLFGAPPSTTQSSLFGAATTVVQKPIFQSPPVATTITVQGSIFGTIAPTSDSKTSIFGTSAQSGTQNITTPPPATQVSTFGRPFNQGSLTPTAAGTQGSIFGSPSTQNALFGTSTLTTQSAPFSTFPTTQPSVFNNPTNSSLFGTVTAQTSSAQTGSIFGTPSNTAFASPTTTTITSTFNTATTNSVFGSPVPSTTFGSPTAVSSSFGSNNFANAAGQSAFGSASTFSSVASAPPTNTAFAQSFGAKSVFGATTTTTSSVFGASPNAAPFGVATCVSSPFGSTPSPANAFGKTAPTSSSFSFSAAAAANVPNTSAFGFAKQSSFGFANTSTDTGMSFGNLNVGNTPTSSATGFNTFGQSQNPFGRTNTTEQKSPFSGGSLFGTPATTTSSIFGGASSSPFNKTAPPFGSPAAFPSSTPFGQQPAFGQGTPFSSGSAFGSPQQGAFSGGSQSVNQTGFGSTASFQKPAPAFGSSSTFGGNSGFGSPPSFGGAPAFGNNPPFGNKVFGGATAPTNDTFAAANQQQSSTFANLAQQPTLGFGSLAQQTPTVTSQPSSFGGGSSFNTWR